MAVLLARGIRSNTVFPCLSTRLRSAPEASNRIVLLRLPALTAAIRGVLPCLSGLSIRV